MSRLVLPDPRLLTGNGRVTFSCPAHADSFASAIGKLFPAASCQMLETDNVLLQNHDCGEHWACFSAGKLHFHSFLPNVGHKKYLIAAFVAAVAATGMLVNQRQQPTAGKMFVYIVNACTETLKVGKGPFSLQSLDAATRPSPCQNSGGDQLRR